MASGRRSVTNNISRRPTALEVTQSKNITEHIETNTTRSASESSEELNYELQEYVNKLEEQNGILEEELNKIRRLTSISLPGSLLTVIFPNTPSSSLFKDKLSSTIQEFCHKYREELKQADNLRETKDQKLISVEFNDLFFLERTSTMSSTNNSNTPPTNIPKYSQVYTRIIQPKSSKQVQNDTNETLIVKPLIRLDSSQQNRPAPKCFNCEGNHHLKNCKEIKDMNKIRANKQEYHNAQGGDQQIRFSNSDQDNFNPESSKSRREEFKHPQSYNSRESYRREPYHHEPIEMKHDEPQNYSNHHHPYSRDRSRDKDERVYRDSRHNNYHFYSEDRSYSHHSYNNSERDVHRRSTSTPNKGSVRDVRKVDIRDKLNSGEYSNTYADMDLSDQDPELEEGEIANRSPRHGFRSPPPLPPFNPYISPPPPPPPMYQLPHSYYDHPRNSYSHSEYRREPPRNSKYQQHSQSMPDIPSGVKRRLSRRSPVRTNSRDETYQDSSDTSNTFKTNEHNFSLDFPPGIVTEESMRAPERFNNIRRIINRRK